MSFKLCQSLQPVIGNPHTEERRIVRQNGIEIQIVSVMRPTRISDAHPHQLGPLLIGAIKYHQCLRIRRDRRDITSVRRPGPASFQILAFGGAFVALGFLTNSIYGRMGGKVGSFARRSVRFRKATRFVGGGSLVALGVAAALAPASHRPATGTR